MLVRVYDFHIHNFKSSYRTDHLPSLGKPGAEVDGPFVQPAAIIAVAASNPPLPGKYAVRFSR
jgi:hypothetical protein